MEAIYDWVMANISNYTWLLWVYVVLAGLGSLVDIGEKLVLITPTTKDDEFVAKINTSWLGKFVLGFLKMFSLTKHVEVTRNT